MCGIVGAIAQRDIGEILLEGLRRLEYRGYDSAGLAIINHEHQLECLKAIGKIKNLTELYEKHPLTGNIGIAHTRWATHGKPLERNAHPHQSHDTIALVHNGIIENYQALRKQLTEVGYEFQSDTDTETIVHLLHLESTKTDDFLQAVRNTIAQLEGAYALGIINKNQPDQLIAVRSGSPLVIGMGFGENFIASDTLALLPVTQRFIFLEEDDLAVITRHTITIYDDENNTVQRGVHISQLESDSVSLGKYRHYMEKEIFEQPEVLQETIEGRIVNDQISPNIFGPGAEKLFEKIEHIQIVACGTSYNAGVVAKYWLEDIAGVPCRVEIASEIRYRKHVVHPNTLFVTISQSGETADTLAALRQAKALGYLATLTICNMPESSLVRESDLVFITRAGREIGVASTKAFTTQLTSLLMLTTIFAKRICSKQDYANLIDAIKKIPTLAAKALRRDKQIKVLAEHLADKGNVLFLGRGTQYPVAMEGALKLKEISYIHAEAYPAGELKHGPLALVDKDLPVITVAPNNDLLEKLKSNLQEVRARGGELIIFADKRVNFHEEKGMWLIELPVVEYPLTPIIYTIPLQLLAYHVAVIRGTDVDHPRNLAKSVTVE